MKLHLREKGELIMIKGHTHNNNHFTGKKKGIKTLQKRVVRPKQKPHINKYASDKPK